MGPYNANLVTNWVAKFQNCLYDNDHDYDHTLPENEDELVTYSVYMGGDIGESVITTNRPKLPNILIYGDSFTNPLETLLWTQANELQSIDFRYYTQCTLKDYIAEHKPDIVICVRDETTFLSEAGNGITE